MNEFAIAFKTFRISEGMTQCEIAKKLGVPVATERGWEQSRVLPKAGSWKKIKMFCADNEMFPEIERAYLNEKGLSRV